MEDKNNELHKYKQTEEFIGNMDDEPKAKYGNDFSKLEKIIYDRLEQLHRELKIEELSAKVVEYNHVRIDELQVILRLIELRK